MLWRHSIHDHKADVLFHLHGKLNKWMGPGGHIESGEFAYQALEREIEEETGLIITLDTKSLDDRTVQLTLPYYKTMHVGPTRIVEDEVYCIWVEDKTRFAYKPLEPFKWMPIEEALKLDMFEDTRNQLGEIFYNLTLDEVLL